MIKTRRLILPLLALAALSACKDQSEPDATPPDPTLTIDGAAVDPLCFLGRIDHDDESATPVYPARDCSNKEYMRDEQNASPLDGGFVSAAYYYVDPDMPDQKYPGFIGYKYLGDYRGLKAVQLIENGGGSGMFTSVQLLRPEENGTLRVIQTLAGGDRCNGGIAQASMAGRTLIYDVNLTPFDFIALAQHNPANLQAYDDIDACAVCCYGTLRYVNGRAESVSLNPAAVPADMPADATSDRPLQACFDQAFRAASTDGDGVMSLKQNKKFIADFFKSCTAP